MSAEVIEQVLSVSLTVCVSVIQCSQSRTTWCTESLRQPVQMRPHVKSHNATMLWACLSWQKDCALRGVRGTLMLGHFHWSMLSVMWQCFWKFSVSVQQVGYSRPELWKLHCVIFGWEGMSSMALPDCWEHPLTVGVSKRGYHVSVDIVNNSWLHNVERHRYDL